MSHMPGSTLILVLKFISVRISFISCPKLLGYTIELSLLTSLLVVLAP